MFDDIDSYTFDHHMIDDMDIYTFNHHMIDDIFKKYTFNHHMFDYIYVYIISCNCAILSSSHSSRHGVPPFPGVIQGAIGPPPGAPAPAEALALGSAPRWENWAEEIGSCRDPAPAALRAPKNRDFWHSVEI